MEQQQFLPRTSIFLACDYAPVLGVFFCFFCAWLVIISWTAPDGISKQPINTGDQARVRQNSRSHVFHYWGQTTVNKWAPIHYIIPVNNKVDRPSKI